MFVMFGKIFAPLLYPLGIACSMWAAAVLCQWRGHRHLARRLIGSGIFIVLYFSQPWVGDAMMRSLEDDYLQLPAVDMPTADAIVVLGGMTGPHLKPRVDVDVNDAFDRLLYGVRLWRAGKAERLILSGGVITSIEGSQIAEAQRMRQLAVEYGVDEQAILTEERSRTTAENALYTAPIIRQRGWGRVLLVTSAQHMRRSVGVFQAQGVEVTPAPTDAQAVNRPLSIGRFLPDVDALRMSHKAAKEYIGLFVYWLRGWL